MTNNNVKNSVVKDYIFDVARFNIVDKINDVENDYYVTEEFASQIKDFNKYYKGHKKEIKNMLDTAIEISKMSIGKNEAIRIIKEACRYFHSGASQSTDSTMDECYFKIIPHFFDEDYTVEFGFDMIWKGLGDTKEWVNGFYMQYDGEMPWMNIDIWKKCCAALAVLGLKEVRIDEREIFDDLPSKEEFSEFTEKIKREAKDEFMEIYNHLYEEDIQKYGEYKLSELYCRFQNKINIKHEAIMKFPVEKYIEKKWRDYWQRDVIYDILWEMKIE